ncbi:hypothetical protein ACFPIJ_61860 [Dactylosporangium cerinum]|uniref:Uncharacterized protein n=1 Tax=Dactylosporangium cerinum TaxID=1434730 RepID=A0ABV9WJF4_9ACTN
MATQQRLVDTQRWRLHRQVASACGPATQFSRIEWQLAEWISSGGYASPATRDIVEPYLAGYLQQAAAVGRRWGTFAGVGGGVVLGLVLFLIVLAAR